MGGFCDKRSCSPACVLLSVCVWFIHALGLMTGRPCVSPFLSTGMCLLWCVGFGEMLGSQNRAFALVLRDWGGWFAFLALPSFLPTRMPSSALEKKIPLNIFSLPQSICPSPWLWLGGRS